MLQIGATAAREYEESAGRKLRSGVIADPSECEDGQKKKCYGRFIDENGYHVRAPTCRGGKWSHEALCGCAYKPDADFPGERYTAKPGESITGAKVCPNEVGFSGGLVLLQSIDIKRHQLPLLSLDPSEALTCGTNGHWMAMFKGELTPYDEIMKIQGHEWFEQKRYEALDIHAACEQSCIVKRRNFDTNTMEPVGNAEYSAAKSSDEYLGVHNMGNGSIFLSNKNESPTNPCGLTSTSKLINRVFDLLSTDYSGLQCIYEQGIAKFVVRYDPKYISRETFRFECMSENYQGRRPKYYTGDKPKNHTGPWEWNE